MNNVIIQFSEIINEKNPLETINCLANVNFQIFF